MPEAATSLVQDVRNAQARCTRYGFSPADQDLIRQKLTHSGHPGTKAGFLLRAKLERPGGLGLSPIAQLVYWHVASFMTDAKPECTVTALNLAKWTGRSKRSVSAAVRELTRSGRLPLLTQTPGRPGRASKFGFVFDPFAVAAALDVAAANQTENRGYRINATLTAIIAAGELETPEGKRKVSAARALRQRGLPKRPRPTVAASTSTLRGVPRPTENSLRPSTEPSQRAAS